MREKLSLNVLLCAVGRLVGRNGEGAQVRAKRRTVDLMSCWGM